MDRETFIDPAIALRTKRYAELVQQRERAAREFDIRTVSTLPSMQPGEERYADLVERRERGARDPLCRLDRRQDLRDMAKYHAELERSAW